MEQLYSVAPLFLYAGLTSGYPLSYMMNKFHLWKLLYFNISVFNPYSILSFLGSPVDIFFFVEKP